MATGYTKDELDLLLHIMENEEPPVPEDDEKRVAPKVKALKGAGTDKGAVFNIDITRSGTELFWFNCWVAKELAGAISYASQTYGWGKRDLSPKPSGHLRIPERSEVTIATEVLSLSALGDSNGILVRLAVGQPIKYRLLFFPAHVALEIALAIVQGGKVAEWWGPDFELIPNLESQH